MRTSRKIMSVLPFGAVLLLAGAIAPAMAQVNTTVSWAPASCPNQMYQLVGGLGLTVLNPRSPQWDLYAAAPTFASGNVNGYAYMPDKGYTVGVTGVGTNLDPVSVFLVNDKGVAPAGFTNPVASFNTGYNVPISSPLPAAS